MTYKLRTYSYEAILENDRILCGLVAAYTPSTARVFVAHHVTKHNVGKLTRVDLKNIGKLRNVKAGIIE